MIGDVNRILKDDLDCKPYIPIEFGDEESIAKAFQCGVVMSKLLNILQPGAVDMSGYKSNRRMVVTVSRPMVVTVSHSGLREPM